MQTVSQKNLIFKNYKYMIPSLEAVSIQKYLLENYKKLLDIYPFVCYIIGVRKNNNTLYKRKED